MCSTNEPSRRDWMRYAGVTAAGMVVGKTGRFVAAAETAPASPRVAMSAEESLRDLLEGNERFVRGRTESPRRGPEDFSALAGGQFPHACIIGCADSRVPPEILFDQGVGDLFVVRVAGNVVGGTGVVVKGSVEYAVAELKVPLVMVLGHSSCGAVKAAVQLLDDRDALPGSIDGLVNLIKPAVDRVRDKPGDKVANAVRANVELGVERLKTLEPILADAVAQKRVRVLGATYDLKSGRVALVA